MKTDQQNSDKRHPVKNDQGELKCYNCGLFGHISKNCLEPKEIENCKKCGQNGHAQRHCSHTVQTVSRENDKVRK